MVLDRRIDASAIDSTVLELELEREPRLADRIRITETLGSSPIPPWVASSVSPEIQGAIREVFVRMHKHPEGREILASGQIDHFAMVEDRDSDAIREMGRQAQRVRW